MTCKLLFLRRIRRRSCSFPANRAQFRRCSRRSLSVMYLILNIIHLFTFERRMVQALGAWWCQAAWPKLLVICKLLRILRWFINKLGHKRKQTLRIYELLWWRMLVPRESHPGIPSYSSWDSTWNFQVTTNRKFQLAAKEIFALIEIHTIRLRAFLRTFPLSHIKCHWSLVSTLS